MHRGVRGLAAPASRLEARVLGGACGAAGTVTFGTVLLPFSRTAPTHLALLLAVVGWGLGGALWLLAGRVPTAGVHAVVATASSAISVCVLTATTPAGVVVTSFGYVWVALFTAWFHSARAAAAQLAAIGLGFALGLWLAGAPSPVQTWLFVMATIGGVAGTLNSLVRRLRGSADRDALTGLLNRMAFRVAAERAIALARRHGRPLSIAVIDLDDFKRVNDRDGHLAGDRLLVGLASSWSDALRGGDLLGRYGGDEFVLLMPETTAARARGVLDRLAASSTACSWTAGVAAWSGQEFEQWIAAADADLYAGKGARAASA
jgi:diguanylate cyclase (GGDEF)-like protein